MHTRHSGPGWTTPYPLVTTFPSVSTFPSIYGPPRCRFEVKTHVTETGPPVGPQESVPKRGETGRSPGRRVSCVVVR